MAIRPTISGGPQYSNPYLPLVTKAYPQMWPEVGSGPLAPGYTIPGSGGQQAPPGGFMAQLPVSPQVQVPQVQGPYAYRGGSRWTPTQEAGGTAPAPNILAPVHSVPPRTWPTTGPTMPATSQAQTRQAQTQTQAQAQQAPGAIQQLGLGQWYQKFQQQHGGKTPEQFYGGNREGMAEALADREWSQGFERSYGRPPTDDDWKAWYFHSRGGGSYGVREAWRDAKGMSDKEYKKALRNAGSEAERRRLKKFYAASHRGGEGWQSLFYRGQLTEGSDLYNQFVAEKGQTPEQFFATTSAIPTAPGYMTQQPGMSYGQPAYVQAGGQPVPAAATQQPWSSGWPTQPGAGQSVAFGSPVPDVQMGPGGIPVYGPPTQIPGYEYNWSAPNVPQLPQTITELPAGAEVNAGPMTRTNYVRPPQWIEPGITWLTR